jgi:hypothetical protein
MIRNNSNYSKNSKIRSERQREREKKRGEEKKVELEVPEPNLIRHDITGSCDEFQHDVNVPLV